MSAIAAALSRAGMAAAGRASGAPSGTAIRRGGRTLLDTAPQLKVGRRVLQGPMRNR